MTAHVVVADDVLFGREEDAAKLDGFGTIQAELARELATTAAAQGLGELRRLYVTPETGALVAADSRSRFFAELLAQLIGLRDQICARRGAMPRSGTTTTSSASPPAARRAWSTVRACARRATTRRRPKAGAPAIAR